MSYRSGASGPECSYVSGMFAGSFLYLGSTFFLPTMPSQETAPEDNMPHGDGGDRMTSVEGDNLYYKLSYDAETKSVLGFYWGAPNGAPFISKSCLAYLAFPVDKMNAQQLQAVSLIDMENFCTATGTSNTNIMPVIPFRAYDINGRIVNAKSVDGLKHGIYIINGKKIIK